MNHLSQMASEPFKREDRYIVIKRSDLANVPVNYRSTLVEPMLSLLSHLPSRECLVIESDWPEYEPTWTAIKARVMGEPAEQPQGEPIMLTAVATLVDDGDGGLEASWLLVGGTAELFAGMTLLVAENAPDLCQEDGSAEVYTHADPGEVERLRQMNREGVAELEDRKQEIYALRTQLGELKKGLESQAVEGTEQGEPS
ncbi:hypothetical protein [Pseudomonas guariconensis]|uniref:Uncharacterized protein n=1 Tax=Pseudomonas guariconensis TaxID=1288410 RepID=A0AAX0VUY2_9PSED|nr:hypothetical protein [Pseudomonas guariconensis]PLV18421.1 hypothetical protein CXG49_13730 [Pseudomonas guariconensis]PLV23252.1 hypothetical protein CXG53_15140 [Pseudomonas guariconensis]PLV28275.1 hypothetical protein CXG51_15610 [Pseudomonas guariconensis]